MLPQLPSQNTGSDPDSSSSDSRCEPETDLTDGLIPLDVSNAQNIYPDLSNQHPEAYLIQDSYSNKVPIQQDPISSPVPSDPTRSYFISSSDPTRSYFISSFDPTRSYMYFISALLRSSLNPARSYFISSSSSVHLRFIFGPWFRSRLCRLQTLQSISLLQQDSIRSLCSCIAKLWGLRYSVRSWWQFDFDDWPWFHLDFQHSWYGGC